MSKGNGLLLLRGRMQSAPIMQGQTMQGLCGVCRTAVAGVTAALELWWSSVCSTTPSAGSIHSTSRWQQRFTKASLLSRGSIPRYHAVQQPPALRSPRSVTASPAEGRAACAPGCAGTQPNLTAVLLAVLALPGVAQVGR